MPAVRPPTSFIKTLGDLLRDRGLLTAATVAVNTTLHAEDVSEDFPDTASMVRAGVIGTYDRMQDGIVIRDGSAVLSFAPMGGGLARLTAFRTFKLRARGNVPGDIVYDYDAAHLLHAFIARATTPTFYDAFEIDGLDDLIGTLIVRWPSAENVVGADDEGLVVL